MRIKVTGSSGFVGSLLSKTLNLPLENRYDILDANNQMDITKSSVTDLVCQQCDVIVHLAAISGLKACNDNPDKSHDVNTEATITLAEKAKKSGVKRFIFASSSAVYGEAQQYRMDESHPCEPRSIYGKQKLEAESILKLACKNFEVVILRKSNLYGYGLSWKGITVIDQFIERVIKGDPLTITGNGSQRRDFLHVLDAVNVYAKIAKSPKVRSGIYNLGGSETPSIREIAEKVNDTSESIFCKRSEIKFIEDKLGIVSHDFKYDSSKARCEFQYSPLLNIDFYIKERLLIELRK